MESEPKTVLNFDNVELAFKHKNDKELSRTYRLFKKIDSPFLTRIGPPVVSFALRIGLPVTGLVRRTIFDIFCGGESIEGTQARTKALHEAGVYTILDYSVEGEKNEKGFDETCAEIIRTLEYGAKRPEVAFSAMKVTGIANFDQLSHTSAGKSLEGEELQQFQKGKERMERICQKAFDLGQPVFVDAEESWIQNTIDLWAEEMMEQYNKEKPIVYTTVQLYRHDRLDYLRGLIERAQAHDYILGVKLVRGAYLEKENDRALEKGYGSPMQKSKQATDDDYNRALELCAQHNDRVAICAGTHNEASSRLLTELMAKYNIPQGHPHFIFAQLLGMSDHISFNLAFHGYNSAKYVPYGPVKAVLPYLFRRANENTSVGGQASREVELLAREMKRRKLR